MYHLQQIKRDNEAKGTRSCKIALYRAYLQCGVKTWEKVITALENCGHEEIAEKVKTQLLKAYGAVEPQPPPKKHQPLQVDSQLQPGVRNDASVIVKDGMYCYG